MVSVHKYQTVNYLLGWEKDRLFFLSFYGDKSVLNTEDAELLSVFGGKGVWSEYRPSTDYYGTLKSCLWRGVVIKSNCRSQIMSISKTELILTA